MPLTPNARRTADAVVPRLAPGRYLAIDDGAETVLVPLRNEVTRVSRSPAADLTLDDAVASRRHALFVLVEHGVEVVDDRSLNGTWVNGQRVDRQLLAPGDRIVVGRTTLRYVEVPDDTEDHTTAPLPAV